MTPARRVARTRHGMPWEKTGPLDRTRVFDTFVAGGRADPRFVRRPDAHLGPDDRAALRRLARHRSSLGRAEGWGEADLATPPPPAPRLPRPAPDPDPNGSPAAAHDPDPVPVLGPDSASAFAGDHSPARPRAADPPVDGPRGHLGLDTQTVRDQPWPRAPGSRWVTDRIRDQWSVTGDQRIEVRMPRPIGAAIANRKGAGEAERNGVRSWRPAPAADRPNRSAIARSTVRAGR
jgi:hypothetical protein